MFRWIQSSCSDAVASKSIHLSVLETDRHREFFDPFAGIADRDCHSVLKEDRTFERGTVDHCFVGRFLDVRNCPSSGAAVFINGKLFFSNKLGIITYGSEVIVTEDRINAAARNFVVLVVEFDLGHLFWLFFSRRGVGVERRFGYFPLGFDILWSGGFHLGEFKVEGFSL